MRRPALIGPDICLVCATFVICAVFLVQSRRDAADRALDASQNVALLIARETFHHLETYDFVLKSLIEALQYPEVRKLAPQIQQTLLLGRTAMAAGIGSFLVLDREGNVVLD